MKYKRSTVPLGHIAIVLTGFHFEIEDPLQRRETLICLSLDIHDSTSSFYVVKKDRTLS